MTTDPSATLAGILDDIRVRVFAGNFDDAPVLLAAIKVVLKLHRPIDRGRVWRCCEGCEEVNGEFHEDCCHDWPCPTYEAITTALTAP